MKKFLYYFISSLFGAVFVLALLFVFAYSYQDKIIGFILDKTQQQTKELIENGDLSKSKREIITQESLMINTIKKANPAVVSIVITKDVPIIEKYYQQDPFIDPFFQQFFGDFFSPFEFRVPQYRQKGTEKREVGGGSGFFVSSDGYIVTNKHVVADKDAEYTVFTNDGKKYDAKVIARDPVNDIAILKIKGNNFPYLRFADSDKIQLGQVAIAIGNALGEFRNTVSAGIISGLSRSIVAGDNMGQSELLEGVIQTDAAINPGNSGGPLLNLKGEVMGVNVAMVKGSQNIGFALPSNLVKSVVDSVKKHGRIIRPYLGVRYLMINEKIKEANKLSVSYGALVVRGEKQGELAVLPGSPADKAGIVENDIILEVNGVKVQGKNTLSKLIRDKKVGDVITLKILHKGEMKEVKVKLEEMPE